jgi:hypothetical protein
MDCVFFGEVFGLAAVSFHGLAGGAVIKRARQ